MTITKNIFFIGPASVGKTMIGSLLAKKLNFDFIDIDAEFNKRIALIPHYIQTRGYPAYCEATSSLVDTLVQEHPKQTVFATPSGFLVHRESSHLVVKHLGLIKKDAISVLLLPTHTPEESVQIIVNR
jgi:shikimate kinase